MSKLTFFPQICPTIHDSYRMIETKGLTMRYGELLALDHLELSIPQGEIFRLSRSQRSRQDNHYQVADWSHVAHLGIRRSRRI